MEACVLRADKSAYWVIAVGVLPQEDGGVFVCLDCINRHANLFKTLGGR